MQPPNQPTDRPSYHLIAVRAEPPGQYTARVMWFPEIRAVAATEQEAIELARQQLTEWLTSARLVEVAVPVPQNIEWANRLPPRVDPNDPCEQAYLEELERLRREDLEQTLREYDQECPDTSSTATT